MQCSRQGDMRCEDDLHDYRVRNRIDQLYRPSGRQGKKADKSVAQLQAARTRAPPRTCPCRDNWKGIRRSGRQGRRTKGEANKSMAPPSSPCLPPKWSWACLYGWDPTEWEAGAHRCSRCSSETERSSCNNVSAPAPTIPSSSSSSRSSSSGGCCCTTITTQAQEQQPLRGKHKRKNNSHHKHTHKHKNTDRHNHNHRRMPQA